MEDKGQIIEKAALLHDIGKVLLRADPVRETHAKVGADFLKQFVGSEGRDLWYAAGHHHAADIKNANPPADDLSYIVYEADNLAAAADRRKEEDASAGFCATQCLESIFNVFDAPSEDKSVFRLRPLMQDEERMQYPLPKGEVQADRSAYQEIKQQIEVNFRKKSPVDMSVNELLSILEASMSYVPSSTATDEPSDVSLYDHVKLTAAYAVCMYRYFSAHGITDYRTYCCLPKAREMRREKMFLLVSCDLSGIQQFIYTIPSKGALKSLRGRSFYLDLMLEHMADEILTACGVSRCALIYAGGGHFYMLLPNTEETVRLLQEAERTLNRWFLENFGTRLFAALAWVPCSAEEFMQQESPAAGVGNVFRTLAQILSEKKLCRYEADELAGLFAPESAYNAVAEGGRECGICHISSRELAPYGDDEDGAGAEACVNCRGLYRLGAAALGENVFLVQSDVQDDALPLPSLSGASCSLAACSKRDAERTDKETIVRIYVKNHMITGELLATRLWLGDYITQSDAGAALDFSTLAARSGGGEDAVSIRRLGVLRADVDDLGAAFIAGIPPKYATLSRIAALSRQLSLFFKRYMNTLCAGRVNGIDERIHKQFSLFGEEKDGARNVHIVYSGGDDFFLVGAWDDLIETAVDVRRAFARFTNGKLHFSAGLGLFPPKMPVSAMARSAGELEDIAKSPPTKDGIALFGMEVWHGAHETRTSAPCYRWQRFVETVCGEKLAFLRAHFAVDTAEGDDRIFCGKGLLYRMMHLMAETSDTDAAHDRINLARFAYVLARMKPKKEAPQQMEHYHCVRTQLYEWFKERSDRDELLTALQLQVYRMREKGEKI